MFEMSPLSRITCNITDAAKDAHASYTLAYQLLRRAEQAAHDAPGSNVASDHVEVSQFAFDVVDSYQAVGPSFTL